MAGLRALGAPWVVMALCSLMFNCASLSWNQPTDYVELFAGDCAISRGEYKESRNVVPMDLRFGPDQDILSDAGFSNMLYQVLNLKPGAALWAAPVCSTSRGSTQRTASNPMGSNIGVTGLHNIMVGRVVILLCLAMAKKIWWCLEQPKGSLLEGHELFQRMLALRHTAVSRVSCSLGHFGGESLKPIWVYTSEAYAGAFNDYADRSLRPTNSQMVTHYVDSNGKQRIKGGPELKKSQSYPRRLFGIHVHVPSVL
ncbi:unnamed protein product [Durusdinium trenchii]|uniref:Uncharacterized protein n=1 Tax=Durusdinium trenchii TaxID=1381693 RepID=A0ABP0QAN7_9DINO